jgi:hypothetical protein
MEKQQTAVDWLIEQMKQRESQGLTLSMYELEMFAEQANKMFEEQMCKFANDYILTQNTFYDFEDNVEVGMLIEEYYNETFKSE